MKTHWLFGRGPDKILTFKREVAPAHHAVDALRAVRLRLHLEQRCENYVFGTSEGRGCQGCLHRHTRYHKDVVPCFSCPWFREDPDGGESQA